MSILLRAREAVKELQPYQSARSLQKSAPICLDANESPWPDESLVSLNRYPEPMPVALRSRLAGLYSVRPEQVLLGRGSDEGIELLMRAFCEARQDRVLCASPTYGMYGVSAAIQGVALDSVALAKNYSLDTDALLAAVTDDTKIVFVCSPNNPSGNLLARDSITKLCTALQERCLVVVDEAYLEYSGAASAAEELAKYPNLVVLRTLSKAWGLAGLRIGALVAAPDLITLLRKVQAPYPISSLCASHALKALGSSGLETMTKRVAIVQSERTRVSTAIAACSWAQTVYPSDANFILIRCSDRKVVQRFYEEGILIRDRSRVAGLDACVRISIGTPAENNRVIEVAQNLSPRV
ncbi:MAG: histidinol-phosphate transaminase [Kofleriaceae bacterium]|nr:histidinol-phosphate transaminase [Kofleriaceae bacterium]